MHAHNPQARRHRRGFTLSEVLISLAIGSLTLTALMAFYVMSIRFIKTGITLTFQQQDLNTAMELIVEQMRPATRIGIKKLPASLATPPNYTPSVDAKTFFIPDVNTSTNISGNCCLIIDNNNRLTSMVCQLKDKVWWLPDASKAASSSQWWLIAASIRPRTNMFTIVTNSVCVRMTFVDKIDTNKIVIEAGMNGSGIMMSPRNIRGLL